jgi:nitrogen-specific signal transduction histidine kinase/CheY-like chemotaxis protein
MVLASLLKNGKGEPAGLLGAIYDLTEKRKMEKELVKIQKLESLGVLAGGIAHDFNNILTGVMGNISLAKLRAREDGEISQNLSEAEKAIGRAAELSRQLLTFAKGGAPVKKVVALQELLANMVRFVLKGSNISTEFSIQKDLWPIECDEGQINQVIQNIVINAKQAMESGGAIRVRAVNRPMGESEIGEISLRKGDYVEISIQDQGVGIPQKNLARIFDPFFTTKEKGSGLGLAISHSVIQRHEGFIQVKSRPGQGTLFTIFLPASPNLAIRSEIGMEKLETGSGRILVMDDEESILNLLVEMLRLLGYEVETALSGSAAFESYRAARKGGKPFDLVICDLTVPGEMGGLELLGRLKKIDPEIKVIVSSGYSNDASVADYKISGFSDFIAKPYDIYRIGRTVKRVLVPDLPPAASLTAT